MVEVASLFNSLIDNRIWGHIKTHIIHVSLTAKYALNTCRRQINPIGVLDARHCSEIKMVMGGCGLEKQCFFVYILLKL